jgi:hypothetical protein
MSQESLGNTEATQLTPFAISETEFALPNLTPALPDS